MSDNVEKRLKREIEQSTPDVLDRIIASCNEKGRYQKMKKTFNYKPFAAVAAAVLLIFGTVFSTFMYMSVNAVDSIVSIDVNPSIEISVNKKQKVVDVKAVNEDGADLLGDKNYKGMELETAIDSIVTLLKEKGYIDVDRNSVLVSVKNNDKQKSNKLSEKLAQMIYDLFAETDISASILSQSVTSTDQLAELVNSYGISEGKAQLIAQILEENHLLTADSIANLSVNDLNLLISSNDLQLKQAKCKGEPKDAAYIGKDAAKLAALQQAGLAETDVTRLKVKMDCDDGVMVYEVEFKVGNTEYEYEIDPISGKIVDSEIEIDDDDDDNGKHNGNGNGNGNGNNGGNGGMKDDENVDTSAFITEERAYEIAYEKAGIEKGTASFEKIKLDKDDGVYEYDVTLKTDADHYKYEIDAVSGNITSESVKKIKSSNAGGKGLDQVDQNDYIGKEKAYKAALEACGLSESDVDKYSIKLDDDDGAILYEVEIKHNGYEHELKINAVTGEIIKHETEKND